MSVPYSSYVPPTLGQIKDTKINTDTLANGDVLQYNSSLNAWENAVGGGGGGGASITGTDEAAVFKSGIQQGEGDAAGITRNATLAGYCINLDTTNKFVGINLQNPSIQLDIAGGMHITDGANKIEIDGENIGIISGTDSLTLFSHNASAVQKAALKIDSSAKIALNGCWVSYNPITFDAPVSSTLTGLYKIKLDRGQDKWDGAAPFDLQENYNSILGFPTGQIVEYQNQAPITGARIYGRVATGVAVAPASTYTISLYGNTVSFQDRLLYDPMQMRSRKIGSAWVYAGAPTVWRQADTKLIFTIKWYIEGTYPTRRNNNIVQVYANQYRSGSLLRAYQIHQTPGDEAVHIHSGERTFYTHIPTLNEDFNPATDDWLVEIANQSGVDDFTSTLNNVEIICYKAQ
jgi:hypothetical protein